MSVLKFTESTIPTNINQTIRNNDFINLKSSLIFFNNNNKLIIIKHMKDTKPEIIKIGNNVSVGFNLNFNNDINQSLLKQINIKIICANIKPTQNNLLILEPSNSKILL